MLQARATVVVVVGVAVAVVGVAGDAGVVIVVVAVVVAIGFISYCYCCGRWVSSPSFLFPRKLWAKDGEGDRRHCEQSVCFPFFFCYYDFS